MPNTEDIKLARVELDQYDRLNTGVLATEAKQDALIAVTQTDLLAGPTPVTVDNTATGKTLATLLGVALNAGLKVLTLIPRSAGIYWAAAAASAASAALPASGVEIRISKTVADTLKFFADPAVVMDIIQEG